MSLGCGAKSLTEAPRRRPLPVAPHQGGCAGASSLPRTSGGLGFRVEGLGFVVWGLGFRVRGSAFGTVLEWAVLCVGAAVLNKFSARPQFWHRLAMPFLPKPLFRV